MSAEYVLPRFCRRIVRFLTECEIHVGRTAYALQQVPGEVLHHGAVSGGPFWQGEMMPHRLPDKISNLSP